MFSNAHEGKNHVRVLSGGRPGAAPHDDEMVVAECLEALRGAGLSATHLHVPARRIHWSRKLAHYLRILECRDEAAQSLIIFDPHRSRRLAALALTMAREGSRHRSGCRRRLIIALRERAIVELRQRPRLSPSNHHSLVMALLARADLIYAANDEAEFRLVREFGLPAQRIAVRPWVALGDDYRQLADDHARHHATATSSFNFACISALGADNKIAPLIDAFASLVQSRPKRELSLEIYGAGAQRWQLMDRARQRGVGRLVCFRSPPDRDTYPSALGRVHAYLSPPPTKDCAAPAHWIRAMALGVPTLVPAPHARLQLDGHSPYLGYRPPTCAATIAPLVQVMQTIVDASTESRVELGRRGHRFAWAMAGGGARRRFAASVCGRLEGASHMGILDQPVCSRAA